MFPPMMPPFMMFRSSGSSGAPLGGWTMLCIGLMLCSFIGMLAALGLCFYDITYDIESDAHEVLTMQLLIGSVFWGCWWGLIAIIVAFIEDRT